MQIYCNSLLLNGTVSANGGDGVMTGGGGGGSGERSLWVYSVILVSNLFTHLLIPTIEYYKIKLFFMLSDYCGQAVTVQS